MLFRQHQRDALRSTRMMVVLFASLILGMVIVTNAVLALAWIVSTAGEANFPRFFFTVNTALVLLYVFGSYALEVWNLSDGGAKLALQAGGREVVESQNMYEKRLCNVVMEVAIATGIRPPRIFILSQEEAINAFAAGWDIQDSIVAVTRGAVERLSRDELQGVVAHEFSHILHGDMRLNMRLISMVLGLQMIFNLGYIVIASVNSKYGWVRAHLVLAVGVALIAVGWLGWLAGRILSASVSRQREFLADASAVKYTRLVGGLAGALRKIAYQQQAEREQVRQEQAKALAPLFLHFNSFSRWFATHPPISERLKRLGVAYTKFEVADDIQNVQSDVFLFSRLVPEAAMTPKMQTAPAQWAHEIRYVDNVLNSALPDTPLPELEWPEAAQLKQFEAQQRLMSLFALQQVRAALLAYWVIDGGEEQQRCWENLCREPKGKVPRLFRQSVFDLAPDVREPMFEHLVAHAEAWSKEQRLKLKESVRVLLKSYSQPMPRGWLRLAVTRYWLRDNKKKPNSVYKSIDKIKEAVAILSTLMAACLEVPNPDFWLQRVYQRLKLTEMPAVTLSAATLRIAVMKMHRTGTAAAPTLVKVWMHEWEILSQGRTRDELQRDADSFRLMCDLLDTARPPRLIAWHSMPQRY